MCMAHGQGGAEIATERSPTLTCNHEAPIAFQPQCVTGDIAHTLKAEGFDASEDGTGRGQPIVPVAYPLLEIGKRTGTSTTDPRAGMGIGNDNDPMFTLQASAQHGVAYSVALRGREGGATAELGDDLAGCLRASSGGGDKPHVLAFQPGNLTRGAGASPSSEVFPTLKADHGRGASDQDPHVLTGMAVRRLTPTECERLQGFPDGYTQVPFRNKPAADGPRYKALGNSMAVPCMAFIGRRIKLALGLADNDNLPDAAEVAA